MSDTPHHENIARQLAGKWQIPLLLFSGTLLVLGLWRLRPVPKPPTFEELYAHAVSLREAALYPEASAYIEKLLSDPVHKPQDAAKLHRLMAEVIFAHESGNAVHGASNARLILEHSDKAASGGEGLDARLRRSRALACEWLQRPVEAVAEYRAALTAGIERPWDIRRRIIEIERTQGAATPEQLHAACDEFLDGEGVSDELRYWAAEQKVELCELQDKHQEAEKFLSAHAARFSDPMWRKAYDYLQALSWYHVGRLDEAERLLRALRDEVPPGHSLYARSGWLLGRILQAQDSPEVALGLFDEVVNNTTPGPYRTASIMGRAECLAMVDRTDEAIEAYKETIRLTTDNPYGSVVDLKVVRESTTSLYQAQLTSKRLKDALGYLRIAMRLVPPADGVAQASYSEKLADLAMALGRETLAGSKDLPASGADARRREAGKYLVEAAEEYLRLAQVPTITPAASERAIWQAAEAFDLAGERARAADVLKSFVAENPASMRAPMALLRLGQTYQAMEDFPKAIAAYQQNLTDFPRTPSAVASLVPLADCFLATGEQGKAEEILLRIVVRQPNDPLTLITPAALEYRDSLFRLGDLYRQAGEYEKAIARYEEALERYRDDVRADRATYLLAETYRQSATRIRTDLQDPRNLPFKDDLRKKHQQRLERARDLYSGVIERYSGRTVATLSRLEQLYLKLSHLCRADAVYDLSRVGEIGDLRPFAESVDLYDRAAWLYQSDPVSMTAYVQMINCHLRMGSPDKAKMTLQRARWTLKAISDEQFRQYAPDEDRAFWENYLSWLEKTPTFASAGMDASG